jgi:hypothetical protein
MQLTLNVQTLLDLIFRDDDVLTEVRSALVRLPGYKNYYAEALVITEDIARLVLTADPNGDVSHIQIIEIDGGLKAYLLWRKSTWMISGMRRLEVAIACDRERKRFDIEAAKAERITAMARKLCDLMGGSESTYAQYRMRFAALYYEEAGQDEQTFRDIIARVEREITHVEVYIPLSAEILAKMAEKSAASADNNESNTATYATDERTESTEEGVQQAPEDTQEAAQRPPEGVEQGDCAGGSAPDSDEESYGQGVGQFHA